MAQGAEFRFELSTRHLPRLSVDSEGLLAPSDGGPPSFWLRWLRPKVRLVHPFGVLSKAPYGDPGPTTWPTLGVVLGVALAAVLGLAVYGLVRLVRR
jgi:hypothetical protein